MEQLSNKATNGTLSAAEWNQIAAELEAIITGFGYVLDGGVLVQVGQAIAAYSASSDFYSDGGAADAPILNSLGGRQAPQALNSNHDGLRARFRPAFANTGATTVNVNGIGIRNLVTEGGSALSAGALITTQDAIIRYDFGNDRFILQAGSVATESDPVPTRGSIDGFQTTWVAGGTDIIFGGGLCRDDGDGFALKFTGPMTKEIDNTWAVGTNNGGIADADDPVVANTTYHMFALRKDSDGSIDFGFTEDVTGADLLATVGVSGVYSNLRRIGAVVTDDAGLIQEYVQHGDYFQLVVARHFNINDPGTAEVTHVLNAIPNDIRVKVTASINFHTTGNSAHEYKVGGGDETLSAATTSSHDLRTVGDQRGGTVSGEYLTNTSRGIKTRQADSSGSFNTQVAVHGWVDSRGKDA